MALKVLLALALLESAVAFTPRRSLAATAALRPRARESSTPRYAATLEQPATSTALPKLRPEEAFPGVAECPFTAWGAGNDVNLEEERAIPR
jgi:hypothetical protein